MQLLGVKIDDLNKSQVLKKIGEFLDGNTWHQIATVNPEFLIEANRHKKFNDVLNQCDINVADGFGLKTGAVLTGQTPSPRFTGIDLVWEIFKLCEQKNCSVLLLGGKLTVGERAKIEILKKHPKLIIQTIGGGEIKYDRVNNQWWQDPQILSKIKELAPDVIMAALGHPKQELWLFDHQRKLPFVKLGIGVGGSLDFISGSIKRAPLILRQLGLEWLWRLGQEPKRLKRIFNATFKFIYYIFKYQ